MPTFLQYANRESIVLNIYDRIYVAGHTGLVGSALIRALSNLGYKNIITRSHANCDLTEQEQVRAFFREERPEYVIVAAAKVGGILANSTLPAEFIYQNIAIHHNIIHEAYHYSVKRLLYLGSSCIYPRDCPQPMKESDLLTGPLELTNRPYAVAKISGIEMCWSYNRQHGTQYLAAMPTNLYGLGDNYDLRTSHVIPALIRKFYEAKISQSSTVTVWGTGVCRREFMYSDDLADACIFLLNLSESQCQALINEDEPPVINIGYGADITIKELAELICEIVDFKGKIVWDEDKPDGTPRKLLDTTRLHRLGWKASTSLRDGLSKAHEFYMKAEQEEISLV